MDREEARQLLRAAMDEVRGLPYQALVDRFLDKQEVQEVTGRGGVNYQIEVYGFLDTRRSRDLRIVGTVDDGGWRAFFPLTEDLLVGPDDASAQP